jgi:general secretion pathway protein I
VSSERAMRGFTLLEVMIATAIVAMAVTVLLGLANRSLAVHERLQRTTQATLLAQSRLAEIEVAARKVNGQQDEKGDFPPPDELFHWQSVWLDTPLPSVRRIDLTVSWGEVARNEAVTLTSFVHQ